LQTALEHTLPKPLRCILWGAVCKNIISDRFSTKTAISARDSYLCVQR